MHTYMHTTQLVHTQLTRTYSSTHNLLHTNPSPSLFPFLLSPCHLYLSFAACWKKLTLLIGPSGPGYSRRFATATARTASLGSHSRGMIQGRSGKWSGGVEARRALLSDGLPSHEGSPVVTMGVFNTKSWSNGRFGANIAP